MEAVNEGCKIVAQARELIVSFLEDPTDEKYYYVKDAKILLDIAIEKLTSST